MLQQARNNNTMNGKLCHYNYLWSVLNHCGACIQNTTNLNLTFSSIRPCSQMNCKYIPALSKGPFSHRPVQMNPWHGMADWILHGVACITLQTKITFPALFAWCLDSYPLSRIKWTDPFGLKIMVNHPQGRWQYAVLDIRESLANKCLPKVPPPHPI